MSNGAGLLGNLSTTQSGLIVPVPGNTNQYYVFSLDQLVSINGLRYSIVDMTLNGGNGAVTATKNQFITNNVTEKLTAIRDASGTNIWLIAHEWNTNRFLVYNISATGISATPTFYPLGNVHTGGVQPLLNSVGYMKASPDGSKIAVAIRDMGYQVFDFNTTSGLISNPISLPALQISYGLEFSPSSQYLYMGGYFEQYILRYDVTLGSQANIVSSKVQIGAAGDSPIGALQLGPDGKIYVAKTITSITGSAYLGVINNPDQGGATYVDHGVFLGGPTHLSSMGLPNFITSLFELNFTLSGAQQVCENSTNVIFSSSNTSTDFTYAWNVVSGNATINGRSTGSSVSLNFGSASTVVISSKATACGRTQTKNYTITVNPNPVVSITGLDAVYCSGFFNVALTGAPAGGNFKVNGVAATSFDPSVIGNYTVLYSYTNTNGCSNTAIQAVTVNSCCKYQIGNPTEICGDVNTPFCIPLTAVTFVDKGIIGIDYCLQYDPTLMKPTGNYTLGSLVTKGNATWANAYLNTTIAGKVRTSIYYTSSAPAGTLFQGSGDVICIEFKLLAGAPFGANALTSCELDEAYLLTEKPACWKPGTLTVTYDNQLRGKIIYHGTIAKILGMSYAVINNNMAVTQISGTDANCNSISPITTPTANGNFILNSGTFSAFKIVRDIKTLPATPAYSTLRYINGYDTYLMQTITTKQTTGAFVQLPDAYMMIAADMNMNGKVRANDITLVQERIVKKIAEYPQVWNSAPNPYSSSLDWRYIDKHKVDTDPSFVRSIAYPDPSGLGFYRDEVPNVPYCLPIKNQCKNDPRKLYSGILLGDLFDGGPGAQAYPNAGSDPYVRMSTVDQKIAQPSSPVIFEIDDITQLGNNVYRVFVKHALDIKDTLVSFDFAIDYNEKVLSIVDLQETAICKDAKANLMWNDADNSELILTSYASATIPSSGTLFYIDVYKSTGLPTAEDFGTTAAFLNGAEVNASVTLRSATISGVTELLSENSVSIIPNPSIDIAVITYSLSTTDNSGRIEILNSLGQTVKSFNGLSANGSIQLDVSNLSKGVYYCVVISGDKKIIKKLVVS